MNLRYGLTRDAGVSGPISLRYNLASLGFNPSLVGQIDPALATIPEVTINGYTGFGGARGSRGAVTNHSLLGMLSEVRGGYGIFFQPIAADFTDVPQARCGFRARAPTASTIGISRSPRSFASARASSSSSGPRRPTR